MTSLRLRSGSACRSFILGLIPAVMLLTAPAAQAGPAPQPDPDPQTTPAPVADATAAPAPVEEIVVTGSRIPVPANITATSPIQTVTSQEISLEGHTDTTDVINSLPQNIINSGNDFGNHTNPLAGTGGIATADLRGLGPQRTLVLIDGRRLGTGDPSTSNSNPAPDLDQIPAALIERVDVVTGGASAVYGSDAMAGVVNFIMKKDFEGIEIGGQYGAAQHSNKEDGVQALESAAGITPPTGSVLDGDTRDLSLLMGTNIAEGAGNITAYFTYHNQSPVNGESRDFSDCLLGTTSSTSWACENSSNSNKFTLVGTTTRYTVLGNQFLPWPQTGSSPPAEFNGSAYEYMQRQDLRYNAGVFAHLDINDWVKPYFEFGFMDDRTDQVAGPTAIFSGDNPLTADGNYLINCSNPLLSTQQRNILCTPAQIAADTANPGSASADVEIGRRNVEGGGRDFFYEHENYRIVTGAGGSLGDAWKYDAYGQYYYTTAYNNNQEEFGVGQINNALQATGTAANPTCISGGSCVPYNIFTQGAVTAAQLAYLYSPGTSFGSNTEEIVHADFTGDLGKYGIVSPFAKDGVFVNLGAEHRHEALSFDPDEAEIQGNLSGEGALLPLSAGYAVGEGFFEVRAPLAQKIPFAYDLSVDAGYRYSDYNTSAGKTNTYKFEVQYAPIQDVRFRYSYDRAVRAPNLIDLYLPQTYGEETYIGTDPCAPTTTASGKLVAATASYTQCARTGVTAAEYGNGSTTDTIAQCTAGQCGEVIGGNAALKPETADTYSLGISLTPSYLPEFNATIDYWHIALANVIGSIPANVLFNGCLNGTNPSYCSEVVRTSLGSLQGASVQTGGFIYQTNINTAAELVSGIDVQLNYRHPFEGHWGVISAAFSGSYLQHTTTTSYPGAQPYDCAGLFGESCGATVNPRWRHNLRVSWDSPWKLLLSAEWRYIGGTSFDNNSSNPALHFNEEGYYDTINATIPGYSYIDLTAEYRVYKGISVRAGVTNLFDKDPPILPQNEISPAFNSYPTYDILGRQLFMAFNAKF